MLTLDHIAVSTTALPTGTAEVEAALGLPLAPGGQHEAMGTWNRLLSLGPEEYFELIAIEPGAPARRSRAGSTWTISPGRRGDDLDLPLRRPRRRPGLSPPEHRARRGRWSGATCAGAWPCRPTGNCPSAAFSRR
jgi:hypothetical protein